MNRTWLLVLALAVLAGIGGAVAVADRGEQAAVDRDRHLLVDLVREPDGRFRALHTTVVDSGLPRQRGLGVVRPWRVALLADGQVLHEAGLEDPALIRGEFQDPEDPMRIQAVRVRLAGPVHFSVRVPLVRSEARLEFHALRSDRPRPHVVTPEAYQRLGYAALAPLAGE